MIREYTRPSPILNILVEHMEEAAFMYNCHCRALTHAERSWEDLSACEGRMIPHLDGLALGGSVTAGLLKEKLALEEDGDPGEAFATAIVYPMLDLVEPMQWLTEALAQSPPHVRTLLDGLKHSYGCGVQGWLEYFLDHESPAVRAAGAEAVGYRGLVHLQGKLASMQKDADVAMDAMFALSSMGVFPQRSMIVPFLKSEDPVASLRAYELLLKIGDREIIEAIRERIKDSEPHLNEIFAFYLAVSGTLADDNLIRDIIQAQPETQAACLLAMGLCGHAGSIPILLNYLNDVTPADTFTNAFQALRLITGMDYLPQFDLDEASPEDIFEYQKVWKNWWEQNKGHFAENIKWRRGQRLSPAVLFQDLVWPGNPCRYFVHLEASVRYGCSVKFHHDQFYSVQAGQLQHVRQWAEKENGKFNPGLCYYHGRQAG